jgi:glutamine synthetase
LYIKYTAVLFYFILFLIQYSKYFEGVKPMGKFVNSTAEFFEYCKSNEVKFVDFRFTDMKGMWHHVTYMLSAVSASTLDNGMPFDGSSIDAWQPIHRSDMLLQMQSTKLMLM